MKILVVDDDAVAAEGWCLLLAGAGHEVRRAGDGGAGLALLGEGVPDLIILDLLLPLVDGPAFLRRLRANWAWRDVPVLVLTAASEHEIARIPANCGPVEVWRKPAEPAALLARLAEMEASPGGR